MKKGFFTPTIIISVILSTSLMLVVYVAKNIFSPDKTTERPSVMIGRHIFRVEIADNFAKQRTGLSNRPPLAEDQGMLFVFSNNQVRNFWMKDMLFSLDIIWIDDGKVVGISANLPPEGEKPSRSYSSKVPVKYVLEVNGGTAERLGIKEGDRVKINL